MKICFLDNSPIPYTSNDLNSLDELLIHFINNISSDPSTAEKALWKRISKSIEILV